MASVYERKAALCEKETERKEWQAKAEKQWAFLQEMDMEGEWTTFMNEHRPGLKRKGASHSLTGTSDFKKRQDGSKAIHYVKDTQPDASVGS